MSSSPPPSPSQDGPLQRFSFAVCVCGVIGVRCVSLRARVAVARLCLGAREGWARLPGVLPSPLGAAAAATPARLSLSLSLSQPPRLSLHTHTLCVLFKAASRASKNRVFPGFVTRPNRVLERKCVLDKMHCAFDAGGRHFRRGAPAHFRYRHQLLSRWSS